MTTRTEIQASHRAGARRARTGVVVVIGVFAAVHVVYWATGGGLATAELHSSWQLLDLHPLRADPFGSVALLHIQPPLFNLFVGVVERWSPLAAAFTYQLLYLACGLTLVLALRALLVEIGCSELGATAGAVVVALDPTVLSYENTVTYELPVATALVLTAWLGARFVRTRRTRVLVGFVLAATFATLTRALLHPVWLLAVIAIVLMAARPTAGWRAVVGVCAIPVVLVGGWVVKNQVLFDEPSLSSMLGSNLARGVIAPMPRTVVDRLVREGTLTPAARVRAFSPYTAYQPALGPCRTAWTEPVVRALVKRDGISNFNAVCFLRAYHQEQHNAIVLLRERPGDYLGTRYAPAALHFSHDLGPGVESFRSNPVYRGLLRVWNPLLLRADVTVHDRGWTNPVIPNAPQPIVPVSITLLAATLFVLALGAVAAVRLLRRGDPSRAPDAGRVLIAVTVGFVAVVSILTEYGENGRFRFLVDPLVIGVSIGVVVTAVGRRLEARRAA